MSNNHKQGIYELSKKQLMTFNPYGIEVTSIINVLLLLLTWNSQASHTPQSRADLHTSLQMQLPGMEGKNGWECTATTTNPPDSTTASHHILWTGFSSNSTSTSISTTATAAVAATSTTTTSIIIVIATSRNVVAIVGRHQYLVIEVIHIGGISLGICLGIGIVHAGRFAQQWWQFV